VLADVADHRATTLIAVPVMLQRILEIPEQTRRRYDTSSLRVIVCSGSRLSADLARSVMDAFGDILYNFYGSTETGWATVAGPSDLRTAPGTVGRPPEGTRVAILDDQGRTIEGVYRIDPDGKVTRVIGRELERPNGVLVSADDRFLFVADNNNNTLGGARKLWRFKLRQDGTVDFQKRKLLFDWRTGRGPDGLKQDRLGRLYVAGGLNKPSPPFEPAKDKKGGIYVFTPEGKLLDFLPVPRDEVTNCAFGGDDLRTLYITGGGTLYSIRTTTPGRVLWPKSGK